MTDCKFCLHNAVCELWCSQESQNASCYSTDENKCSYFKEDNQWIPVTERLPETSELVLAIDNDGLMSTAYYVGRWHGMLDENSITHWMPLPEPPMED